MFGSFVNRSFRNFCSMNVSGAVLCLFECFKLDTFGISHGNRLLQECLIASFELQFGSRPRECAQKVCECFRVACEMLRALSFCV